MSRRPHGLPLGGADAAECLHWAAIAEYDLIVLDVMLPDQDGLMALGKKHKIDRTADEIIITPPVSMSVSGDVLREYADRGVDRLPAHQPR